MLCVLLSCVGKGAYKCYTVIRLTTPPCPAIYASHPGRFCQQYYPVCTPTVEYGSNKMSCTSLSCHRCLAIGVSEGNEPLPWGACKGIQWIPAGLTDMHRVMAAAAQFLVRHMSRRRLAPLVSMVMRLSGWPLYARHMAQGTRKRSHWLRPRVPARHLHQSRTSTVQPSVFLASSAVLTANFAQSAHHTHLADEAKLG